MATQINGVFKTVLEVTQYGITCHVANDVMSDFGDSVKLVRYRFQILRIIINNGLYITEH